MEVVAWELVEAEVVDVEEVEGRGGGGGGGGEGVQVSGVVEVVESAWMLRYQPVCTTNV